MSRELQATLISGAMIALVFVVASYTDNRTASPSGPVVVYGVELERDASQDAVIAVAEALNEGLEAVVLRDLGVSETELAEARDEILTPLIDEARAEWARELQLLQKVWPYVDAAVAQMPKRAVSAHEEQSQFIASLRLPEDVDDGQIRYLLPLTPEQRQERIALFEELSSRPVEDFLSELRDGYSPRAERQALRQMICDRSTLFDPDTPAQPRSVLSGVSSACAAYVIRHIDELLPEALDEETQLRARVLSALSLAQAY
ncbi:MAG: hypothetical protein AAGM16_07885 [Pseudomonadota bacterium]